MKSEIKISARRLEITRLFDAPRELVFSCWKTAEKLQQWSSCKEAVRCEVQMDFRVGGSFTQKMHIAGAGEYQITGTYDEIVEPERIAYHVDFGPVVTQVLVEFFEQGNQTKVVLTHDGLPEESFSKNVSRGTAESLEKLDHLLASRFVAAPEAPARVASRA